MKKIGFGLIPLIISTSIFANTPIPDVSPVSEGQHVVINIPQQRLFLYTNGQLTKVYPVAVGKAMTQTNLGEHKIGVKAFKPTWHIPKSIQKERNDGVKSIPPGPKNPLGPVFVRLGEAQLGLGIHGTNAPTSVPGVRSHGCIRMKSPDALEFANAIATGSPASVVYQMAALNEDENKNLWLAAYRDPYNKKNLDTAALHKSIAAWAKTHGKNINTKRVDAIIKAGTGSINCLTCAKGIKLKGNLKSIEWTSGSSLYTKAKVIPKPEPVKDEVLPAGSEIEIDAEDTTSNKNAAVANNAPKAPLDTSVNTSSKVTSISEKDFVPNPIAPPNAVKKEIPDGSEPTELLF